MKQIMQLNANLTSLMRGYRGIRETYIKVFSNPSVSSGGRNSATAEYNHARKQIVERARKVFKNRPNLVPPKNNNRTRGLIIQRLNNSWAEPSPLPLIVNQPNGSKSLGY